MADLFHDLLQIDNFATAVLVVMLIGACVLIHVAVDSKLVTALFLPGMALGGLVAYLTARELAVSIANAYDTDVMVLAIAGISAGFMATLCLYRFLQAVGDIIRPNVKSQRSDLQS